MVYDVKVLFDYDSADGNRIKAAEALTGLSGDEDEFYYYGKLDTTVKPQAGYFFIDDNDASFEQLKDKKNEHGYDNGEGIIMMNSANYTLVDFSEGFGADDVVISRKSKGTGLFSRYNTDYNGADKTGRDCRWYC